MPSPEHAANRERVLTRAAQECESKRGVWFGEGLPQEVRRVAEALGETVGEEPAELALVEVTAVSPQGRATTDADPSELGCPVVGVSTAELEDLGSLLGTECARGIQIARLICPVGVFDFTAEGIRVREVRHGLTAAGLQERVSSTLWSGPDLKELGTR
jgi:acyl CoA:acetate/3-ketoacid CoA transferase beta subunit